MQIDVSKSIKNAYVNLLDAFVDSVFEFVDQPLLPSQVRSTTQIIIFSIPMHKQSNMYA